MPPIEAIIAEVKKGSLAAQAGIRKGDVLLSIDGHRIQDFIEYRYLIATDALSLNLLRSDRSGYTVHIEKEEDEDLGLQFTLDVFDGVRTCRCRCAFCFVSHLPKGLRPSLYLRDDDYRLSFLHSNFITLSNLTEGDFRRILKQHLSPLWISVHATKETVRARLMGSRRLPPILAQMKRLTEGGIELHAQVVVCPGINDGVHLEKTVRDLSALHPGVKSIGVVPAAVGNLKEERKELLPFTVGLARQIIHEIDAWQREFLGHLGTSLVWASDEFYLLAGIQFPPAAEYEDFPQLGNGIGESRKFLEELASPAFSKACSVALPKKPDAVRIHLGTGPAASGLVAQLAGKLNDFGLQTEVVVAANRLFGPTVTCSGLISGADWVEALQPEPKPDMILLPKQSLNCDGLFLDDLSRKELRRRMGVPVAFAQTPLEAVSVIGRFLAAKKKAGTGD